MANALGEVGVLRADHLVDLRWTSSRRRTAGDAHCRERDPDEREREPEPKLAEPAAV